jgi:hypothetical protein
MRACRIGREDSRKQSRLPDTADGITYFFWPAPAAVALGFTPFAAFAALGL